MGLIVPKQTEAYVSQVIPILNNFPHVFVGVGTFTTGEFIWVKFCDCEGELRSLRNSEGDKVVVHKDSPPLIVVCPLVIMFDKPETTTACGVERICCTP